MPLYFEESIANKQILNKKKMLNYNHVKRNISTDFLARKNSFINEREYFCPKNNSYIFPKNENLKEELSSNIRNTKFKKQFINAIPYFEFENVYKQRLASENNGNSRSNNNIKIRLNNNIIRNISNGDNKIIRFGIENQCNIIKKNQRYDYNNKVSMRPKSTSSIVYHDKFTKINSIGPSQIIKNSNMNNYQYNKNLTEIYDLSNQRNNFISNKYKDFYHLYYQKYIDRKAKNGQIKINLNRNNCIQNDLGKNQNCRKIIYEKINIIQKNGEERQYIKGPPIIRTVGKGNLNNLLHRERLKDQYLINNIDYSIHNMNSKDFKYEKNGPRIILPKKMIMPN